MRVKRLTLSDFREVLIRLFPSRLNSAAPSTKFIGNRLFVHAKRVASTTFRLKTSSTKTIMAMC